MTQPYAELELSLQPVSDHTYTVELRMSDTQGRRFGPSPTERLPTVRIAPEDREQLVARSQDPESYGKRLSALLFADPHLLRSFELQLAAASSSAEHVRVCLNFTPGAEGPSDLHELRWETLWHPGENRPLANSERECLVRTISSETLHASIRRARSQLSALAAVIAPRFPPPGLDLIDVPAELERARYSIGLLNGLGPSELGGAGEVDFTGLVAGLQQDPAILYLVAHGVQKPEAKPSGYYLVVRQGSDAAVHISQLTEQLSGRRSLPSLAVLLSCYSAGDGGRSGAAAEQSIAALAALGPRLAMAGLPAVIAAQGPLSMPSAELFGRALFENLIRHNGHIDRAVAAARSALRAANRPDWWSPVLFLHPGARQIWQDETATYKHRERLRQWLDGRHTIDNLRLERIARALLACPSAQGIDWDSQSGLDELVESLRFYDHGSPAFQQLEAALSRELPRKIGWRETSELARLLGRVQLHTSELESLFYTCRARECELDVGRDGQLTLAHIVYRFAPLPVQPAESQGRERSWHPLVELLRSLLADYAHKPDVANAAAALRAWAAPITACFGLRPLSGDGATAPSGDGSPARARPVRRATLSIVLIPANGEPPVPSAKFDREPDLGRPESIRVFPFAWLIHSPSDPGGVAAGASPPPEPLPIPGLQRQVCTLSELRGALTGLLTAAKSKAHGAKLVVELCLPVPLLLLDVDSWEAASFYGEATPLGRQHPVAIRVLERIYGGDQPLLQEPWEEKWEQYLAVAAALHEHVRWFWGAQGDTPERVEGDLHGKYVALGHIQPPAPAPPGSSVALRAPDRVLIKAILTGVPAALILREGGDPQLSPKLLAPEQLGSTPLPRAALQWRQQALSDEATYGACCHLTLLWDDASRPPPLPPLEQPLFEQD